LLKRFQEADKIADLAGIQLELGHARMTRHNSFAKRFFERLDRVSQVKSPKRWGNGQGAPGDSIDGMAMRTVSLSKRLAGLHVGSGIAWSSGG
jgi:hypothetical protein